MKTKLNAEQILKIIEENYSVENFAYGEWNEFKGEITFSDKVVEMEKARSKALEAYKAHPGCNNRDLRDESYDEVYKIWCNLPSGYDQMQKEILTSLGLGEIEEVEQYGGEGDGSTWFSVKHFKDHDVYIRTDGCYESYNGTDFYQGYGKEVKPTQITRTEYI